ncbi:peptide synthetase [Rhizobium sp. AAP43]|nr:peptide synthetase [Rhizobium sp. AAP43]
MQAASWVGRGMPGILGGVVPHLYVEFDGSALDPGRLALAIKRLGGLHPMLRLRVDADGRQSIAPEAAEITFEVEDLSDWKEPMLAAHLEAKRDSWTHHRLNLEAGQSSAFGLSLLPEGARRLHVDTDMVAIDPASFRIVMEDLARLYADPEKPDLADRPHFFDWLDAVQADRDLKQKRETDRLWWKDRLASIPPAPHLPLTPMPPNGNAKSTRIAAHFSSAERQALEQCARRLRVTSSSLFLALFAHALGRATASERFRLSVPSFLRWPVIAGVEGIVGDFSNILVLRVEIRADDSLTTLAKRLGDEMIDLLGHSAYPGVSVMRDLSRLDGTVQASPVVFTSGLDLPGGDLFSERVSQIFGAMNWAVSQGPNVALDAQVATVDGGLLINWDIRRDALAEDWIGGLFNDFVDLVRRVARQPATVDLPLSELGLIGREPCSQAFHSLKGQDMERRLNALQQAYLLGRSDHVPLGGVPMQEFREYRGAVDLDALVLRLAALVRQHACLRTHIDEMRLIETISEDEVVNFELIDLTDRSAEDALHHIGKLREAFAHNHFDLHRSPWEVVAFRLPEGSGGGAGEAIIFIRFDALIVDGRAIASLANEIFGVATAEGGKMSRETDTPSAPAEKRSADAEYWAAKLSSNAGPPELPWLKPLETIKASSYRRESLTIARDRFARLSRIGARQRLFKNSMLTSLILEVLSHWEANSTLCVGIPVAPPSTGGFRNGSSFIAVNWDRRSGSFAARCERLQADVLEGLDHLSYSGVDLSRMLMTNNPGSVALPVVITNGLSWPVLPPDHPVQLVSGLTQTPQVAMDIRFSLDPVGNLRIDIDYAREALGEEIVRDILEAIGRAVEALVALDRLDLPAQDFLRLDHYHRNSTESDANTLPFLQRIASHLFDGENGKTALICGTRRLTYSELGREVARAMEGLKIRGVTRGSVVAIALGRSFEHTAVTLAAAFLGAIWVPIDAGSPDDRLRYLLTNCRPDLIVATAVPEGFSAVSPRELLGGDAPVNAQTLALPLDELSLSDDPAYYLYTSGTTGKPKCVVLANRATANVIGSTLSNWAVTDRDVFISVTPLHHDMSVFDVFGCLTAGATLVLPAPGEEKDAIRWNQLVAEHGVTLWCSVPAILEMLLSCRRGDELRSLRLVAQGGDYIKPVVIADLRKLNPALSLISLGGPTETTIWSIWHEIVPEDTDLIPYGYPLPGNRYFLLDETGGHCPTGVVGRIHTAGTNVAIGYLEDGVISQTDFVTVRDETGAEVRAFRTGDRGRFRPDGEILFASRVNGYVKVRGVRVSLPDIENELARHPDFRRVLVVDYGHEQRGDAAIGVLYVAAPGAVIAGSELRAFARRHLPESHIPTRFLAVDDLPLSANGKPDRRRARALLDGSPASSEVPPARSVQDPKEARVLDIYLGVLGNPPGRQVDAKTDFLSLGLKPSHLMAISTRIKSEIGVELTLPQLVRCRNAGEVQALFPVAAG